MARRLQFIAAALAIIAVSIAAFRTTLFPSDGLSFYPWGSDTWGHLIKVEFLRDQVSGGNLYPNVFPSWYGGVQLFRYYAPLPYYGLLMVSYAASDIFLASSWFIFLCSLFGGLSFLLYSRRIGLFPSALGGALFVLLPENVRVAFSEGNIPRVLAAAILPLTLYCAIRTMGNDRHRKLFVVFLAGLLCAAVLTHAMMGAIFLVSLTLFCTLYWLFGGCHARGFLRAVFAMVAGLLLAGQWFLPSLTGGITELDESAASASEAAARFPVMVSFNPLTRLTNPEIFYIGLGLGLAILLGIVFWRRLAPLPKALLLIGMLTVLVTTTFFAPLYGSLPFHHLFYPTRFSTFASFVLLLALLCFWPHLTGRRRVLLSAVLLVTAVDFTASTRLIHLNPPNESLWTAAAKLKDVAGWRVATADLSLLGSSPSYLLSAVGEREQIFGWGYQGARLAGNLSSINYAMDRGHSAYALDRLEQLGTDDVLLLKGGIRADGFDRRLIESGFQPISLDDRLTLFHRDGSPRASLVTYDVLGIGPGAQNLAYLFPKISLGHSAKVDEYDGAYLARFKTLVLSRFSWEDRDRAERAIVQYARGGGTVLVDLTGSPVDVLSRRPKFLGVYGEPFEVKGRIAVERDGNRVDLLPFSREEGPWLANVPQGLDEDVITFDSWGLKGVALGYKDFGGGRVWFTGLNLPFHALITGDPVATEILQGVTGLQAGDVAERMTVALQHYRAGADGYSFVYDAPSSSELVLPIPALDGRKVMIDGGPVESAIVDNLISLTAPAGRHQVRILFENTAIYSLGLFFSILSVLLLLAYMIPHPAGNLAGRWPSRSRVPAIPALYPMARPSNEMTALRSKEERWP